MDRQTEGHDRAAEDVHRGWTGRAHGGTARVPSPRAPLAGTVKGPGVQSLSTAVLNGRPSPFAGASRTGRAGASCRPWREAFRAFGAKPQRTRSNVEALLRRVPDGLPRVDRLTDAYNAVSVAHQVPAGGEDADRYGGLPRLVRAAGDEPFETTKEGADAIEHPEPGEVVWRDGLGVTCRCWNWRQCTRTRLTGTTTRAFFVLDALAPMTDDELRAAGAALTEALTRLSPKASIVSTVLGG